MSRTHKINVIIEVELTEHEHVQPELVHPSAKVVSPADQLPHRRHEQLLLDVLRADPARYAEFVRAAIVDTLGTWEFNRTLVRLAQIPDPYTASQQVLQNLLPHLPLATQTYFRQAFQEL